MKDLIAKLVAERYTLPMIAKGAGVSYHKVWRCFNRNAELKETDINKLTAFAKKAKVIK